MTRSAQVPPTPYPFRTGGVLLTRKKVRGALAASQEAMDEVNELVLREGALAGAPFDWIGVVIREVADDAEVSPEPIVRRVDRGELPVVVDVKVGDLQRAAAEGDLVVAYKMIMLHALRYALAQSGISHGFVDRAIESRGRE